MRDRRPGWSAGYLRFRTPGLNVDELLAASFGTGSPAARQSLMYRSMAEADVCDGFFASVTLYRFIVHDGDTDLDCHSPRHT